MMKGLFFAQTAEHPSGARPGEQQATERIFSNTGTIPIPTDGAIITMAFH